MNDELALEQLDHLVTRIADAPSSTAVFQALLQSSPLAAPRAAIYINRGGRLALWRASESSPESMAALRAFDEPVERFRGDESAAAVGPDFGGPAAHESRGLPIELSERVVAVLFVERDEGREPWHPQLLTLLVRIARLRLGLLVALKRLGGLPAREPAANAAPEEPVSTAGPTDATVPVPPDVPALETESPVASPESTPADRVEVQPAYEPKRTEDPDLSAAQRFARLVATDIRLYNEEAVVLGRRNGDLAQRLEDSLNRGKETFVRRHGALGSTGLGILHEAFVEVLAAGDSSLLPQIDAG